MSETANFLTEKSAEYQALIEDRLLTAYKRIRSSVRNGLAVVSIEEEHLQDHSSPFHHKHKWNCFKKKIIIDEHIRANTS
jgi:hypothetical protein